MKRKRFRAAAGDELKSVDDVMGELNRRYQWQLPRIDDFSKDSELYRIWSLDVDLVPQPPAPLLFKACSKDKAFAFGTSLTGELVIYVTEGPDAPVTPCA
jgi:hypothetical protein